MPSWRLKDQPKDAEQLTHVNLLIQRDAKFYLFCNKHKHVVQRTVFWRGCNKFIIHLILWDVYCIDSGTSQNETPGRQVLLLVAGFRTLFGGEAKSKSGVLIELATANIDPVDDPVLAHLPSQLVFKASFERLWLLFFFEMQLPISEIPENNQRNQESNEALESNLV